MAGTSKGERIAKRIARAGVCSRRAAEDLIAEGRVRVDGALLDSPAVSVAPEARVTIDGRPLPAPEPTRVWRYHKPKGVVTSARDPQGRPTVFERLPPEMPRVVSVGRLDINSEGLLLLTNDGALKRRLELPATGWTRRYRVRVHGQVEPERLTALAQGVRVAGVDYGPIHAALEAAHRRERLAHRVAEGRQDQRGPARPRAHRGQGEPPDPGRLRAVPARPAAARPGGRGAGQGAARAARGGGPRQRDGRHGQGQATDTQTGCAIAQNLSEST